MKRFQAYQTQKSCMSIQSCVEVSTCVAVGGGQFRAYPARLSRT